MTLAEPERKVLQLKYVEGLGLDRIAGRLKISQVTVKRLHRSGIEKLRVHFAGRGAVQPSAPLPADRIPDDAVHWQYQNA